MISAIQNNARQQKTAFKATVVPPKVMNELKTKGIAPKSVADIANDIYEKSWGNGAGKISLNPDYMKLVSGEEGHNILPTKEETKSIYGLGVKGYDMYVKAFAILEKMHQEAKPATQAWLEKAATLAEQAPKATGDKIKTRNELIDTLG